MGKKGTKRKTQWRTLSITEQDEINAASKGNYNNGINTDEASSVDDNFKYSGTNYSYLKRKSSSLNSSSNLYNNNNNNLHINNNNNKYRNDYRNSDSNLNSYYNSNKQHNNNNDITTITNNSNIITTANNRTTTYPINSNYQYNSNNNIYNNTSTTSRYSYRRRPYSMQQNGSIGGESSSLKYYSSYGAGRANSRPNRSYNDTITATSNKENDYPKPNFNEDEYTRITTPRQDVIFKKGYFSRPRPYLSSNTDTNTTSSAAASVVSNEESISATSVPSSLSPEQCSSSQSDSIPDQEHTFMYSYVDQNGIVYVNPYMPNGFDQYSGQMFMMPYGYSPYNVFPPDLNTPPLNENDIEEKEEEENNDNTEITNSDDKKISDNLSNNEELNENDTILKIENNSKSNLDNCDSVDDTSNTEESSIEPIDGNIEKKDEGYINEHYTNINNHCQPNFINFGGFGGQYYPPMFYPLNMYNSPPLMPIIGGPNYDMPVNIIEQDAEDDGDDSDQSTNCTQTNRNRTRRDIQQHTHRNSTGATTTDYSEEECSSDTDDVTQTICEPTVKSESVVTQDKQVTETKSCDNKLNDDVVDKTNDEEICSSITQETDNKQIKFNANVEEFKPRNVMLEINKPHLNVNVKEFLPRSYQTDSSSPSSLDHNDSVIKLTSSPTIEKKEISIENSATMCISNNQTKQENETSQKEDTNQKSENLITKPKTIELTLAEKIKLSLIEEENKKKLPQLTITEDKKELIQSSPRDVQKRNNNYNKITKKVDKTTSRFNKKKKSSSFKHENIIQLPHSPSKISISSSSSPEVEKSNNVLSYAQMVNKDLQNTILPSEISKSTSPTTTTNEDNYANTKDIDDEIDIQILLKSLDAADNLTAAKEKITWQTVKPKGKRGKNYKDGEIEETEPEHTNQFNHDVEGQTELIKKTKSVVNDNKKKPIIVNEEPIKIEESLLISAEEPTVNIEEISSSTVPIKILEKKKSKSKNKKSSMKKIPSNSSKSLEKHHENSDNKNGEALNKKDEALNNHKTDKPEEDATNLARRLFEEIDLSLKTTQKESIDDDDLILGEIYSPNSNLMNKTFGRNPLDIMNSGFYKNSSILKEEEEMVLNVIKSLSSNSNSASPIGGNSNKHSFNIFNASFIEGIGKTVQRTDDSGLKKTSTTENLDKIMGISDKQHVKLSTSEKKHNKLGISRRTGKNNADKLESKNKLTENTKDNNKENCVCELPEKNYIVTEDSTELLNSTVPKMNSNENINNESSEYIKNCIQESFKWIEKSHIPKFTKTIEQHLTNTSTADEMECNGNEIDNKIIKNEVTEDIVKNQPEKLEESANVKIDDIDDLTLEEDFAEECSSVSNSSQVETPHDIQENPSTELEIIKISDEDEIIVNEDRIAIVENENCQENGEDFSFESSSESQKLIIQACSEIEINEEKDLTNSKAQVQEQIQNGNCKNIGEENDIPQNLTQDSLTQIIDSKVSDHNINQCNGDASAPNGNEEFVISIKLVENGNGIDCIENCQLPINTKNIEENFKINQYVECSENGINDSAGKSVNGIDNLQTNITHDDQKHNSSNVEKINGFLNGLDSHLIENETGIQVNGFHEDISEKIINPNKIIENGEITKFSNEIFKNDIYISDMIPTSSSNINTLITPLNIIESEYHNTNNHLPKSFEIVGDKSSSQLSESFEDNIKPRRYERESSTSSSTSLEIQLKMLQEQLMKFDDITIKSIDSSNQTNEEESMKLLSNHNDYQQNPITTSHSSASNPNNNQIEENLEFKNCYDNLPTMTNKQIIVETSQSNPNLIKSDSLLFPLESSLSLEKFPLTQAVKLWLDKESKENTPEPLLRIPNDPMLSSLIKSSISQQSLNQYDDNDENDDTWSLTDEEEHEINNDINDKKLINKDERGGGGNDEDHLKNGVIIKTTKQNIKISKNLKSNPLHVSSVNKEQSLLIDNDSDYNSDSQQRYDDDNNTCERVAKNLSDLINQQQKNNKFDLLEYWDDEFIENPKKYLINNNNNKQNNDEQQQHQRINYERNDSLLSSGCPSISSQNDLNNLSPYESVYGKTINYNQLLLNNNYEFLSNNIININNNNNDDDNDDNNKNITKLNDKNFNNDTLLNKNNNNNFDNNNINNNNNCLKPPEVCCILM